MKITDIQNEKFYMLRRGAYNPNNQNERVLEMRVVTENGKRFARNDEGIGTIRFEVKDEVFAKDEAAPRRSFFVTADAAEAQYQTEKAARVEAVMSQSKEDMIKDFFMEWCNGGGFPERDVHDAMVQKIKIEFGVDVTE